jgi:hypothetical protein
LTLCNMSSFLSRSVQLIFSIILQHHILELSSFSWSTSRSVHFSAPDNAILQMRGGFIIADRWNETVPCLIFAVKLPALYVIGIHSLNYWGLSLKMTISGIGARVYESERADVPVTSSLYLPRVCFEMGHQASCRLLCLFCASLGRFLENTSIKTE